MTTGEMDKTYDYKLHDASIQKWWLDNNIYLCDKKSSTPLYTVDTPPPTISGSLHIGHIFSYTQTDIIARFKRLSGFSVFYPFGFDDNGLPTERFVEKKHGISGYHMGRAAFIELCSKESAFVAKDFELLWKKMGISADWSQTYSTISPVVQKIAQESFIELYRKNYIYQKEEPALYCTTCFTSVAQAELDDLTMPSTFDEIHFTAEDGSNLTIATTRPELLGSCVALFYHPEDSRYTHLQKTKASVPVFEYQVPILSDPLVDPNKGTGLVMCCTFGDKNDITWFKKHTLPYRRSIELDGKWSALTGQLAGLKATQAREKIIELLKQTNSLHSQKAITHAVNVHERCKKPIEYVILKQWFLSILNHKQAFLKEADSIQWFPSYMKSRYRDWVENLQWDWCLSRQRFYGIPFPTWYCEQCHAIKLPEQNELPLDPQQEQPSSACSSCNGAIFTPDTDVMDTWNTSSLTPYICAYLFNKTTDNLFTQQQLPFLPMSMRPQAHDIIRTWAFYTIVKTWMHHGTIPWKTIVISGHVLSNDRDKISKSRDNSPMDPENLLQHYPADAIRYWTASGALGTDIAFSENQIKIGTKLQTKMWNAFKFIKEHRISNKEKKPNEYGLINEWILHRIHETFISYEKALAVNEFGTALSFFEQFFWHDFCDNYIELIKDQFFKPQNYSPDIIAATQWTLSHVGLRILQLLAPYMPHITESLYQKIYTPTTTVSLHTTLFTTLQTPYIFQKSMETTALLLTLIGTIRKLKSEKQLSLKTPLEELIINTTHDSMETLVNEQEQLIKGFAQATKITIVKTNLKESILHSKTINNTTVWYLSLNADAQ